MPTLDTLQLPRIDTGAYGGREAKKIVSHLYQVEEQLRYVLGHLDEDNLAEGLKSKIESGGMSSEILQTLDAITLRVSGQDDAMAELRVSLTGITSTVQEQGGHISTLQQTAESITATVAKNQEEAVSMIEQTAESITQTVEKTYATKQSVADGDAATLKSAKSQIEQTASSITSEVSATYATKQSVTEGDAATLESAKSQIKQTADSITSEVSATYATKTSVTEGDAATLKSAQSAIEQTAGSITQTVEKTYATRTELSSQIRQTAESITSEVSATYATKTSVTEGDAATLKSAQSAIDQTADSITTAVSATYATKTSVTDGDAATLKSAQSAIEQTADSITQTVEGKYATKTSVTEGDTNTLTTARSEIKQRVESIKLSVTNGASSSTLTIKAGETTLSSANITFSGLVNFVSKDDLKTSGKTTINGSNITTGTIQSTNGTTRYNLDSGNIQMGADDKPHIYEDNQMIRWYLDKGHPTGIFYSIEGYTWIGANSRNTYFGWMTNSTPAKDNGDHWRGMAVDNQDSRTWFNTAHVDVASGDLGVSGAVNAKTLYVHGTGDGDKADLQKLDVHGDLGCDQTINCQKLSAWNGKDRVVPTAYGALGIAAMESPAPAFCDFGGGVCDENGECYLVLDERYQAVTEPRAARRWVLTDTCGGGPLWVENTEDGPVVHGEPGQTFDWLCLSAQKGTGGEYAEICYDRPPWLDPPLPDLLTEALESAAQQERDLENILLEVQSA